MFWIATSYAFLCQIPSKKWDPRCASRAQLVQSREKSKYVHIAFERRVFPWLGFRWHSHIVLDRRTEGCEASAANSCCFRSCFQSEDPPCYTSGWYSVLEIILSAILDTSRRLSVSDNPTYTYRARCRYTPSIKHSVPANIAPIMPKFFAELNDLAPISLKPRRNCSRTGRLASCCPCGVRGVS